MSRRHVGCPRLQRGAKASAEQSTEADVCLSCTQTLTLRLATHSQAAEADNVRQAEYGTGMSLKFYADQRGSYTVLTRTRRSLAARLQSRSFSARQLLLSKRYRMQEPKCMERQTALIGTRAS